MPPTDLAPRVTLAAAGVLLLNLSGPAFAADFTTFQRDESPAIATALGTTPKHYRQIEPSLYHLAERHAATLDSLPTTERRDRLVALARFIDAKRTAVADAAVIAPGRSLIGLLDPDHGLAPREITALAAAYHCTATIFKKTDPTESLADVAAAFLKAVTAAAQPKAAPTTIVVLGHGLPTEIQSYHIPVAQLADTLVAAATPAEGDATVDLGTLTIICDDCYSADFMINLSRGIVERCHDRSLRLAHLPTLIAGTNRDCVGHADVSAAFVPHFWKDVIELFYIRKPHPEAITLGDFFEKVDNMMYGYGRQPIISGSHVTGYRLTDPTMVQDPVVFVPLSTEECTTLRSLLGLGPDDPCDPFLDIG